MLSVFASLTAQLTREFVFTCRWHRAQVAGAFRLGAGERPKEQLPPPKTPIPDGVSGDGPIEGRYETWDARHRGACEYAGVAVAILEGLG